MEKLEHYDKKISELSAEIKELRRLREKDNYDYFQYVNDVIRDLKSSFLKKKS